MERGLNIPYRLARSDSFSASAKLTFAAISHYSFHWGTCKVSYKDLRSAVRLSIPTIKRSVSELSQAGLIQVKRNPVKDSTGRVVEWEENRYTINWRAINQLRVGRIKLNLGVGSK